MSKSADKKTETIIECGFCTVRYADREGTGLVEVFRCDECNNFVCDKCWNHANDRCSMCNTEYAQYTIVMYHGFPLNRGLRRYSE